LKLVFPDGLGELICSRGEHDEYFCGRSEK
jgi:hypothetical protein